jgi:mono/diheme cytochrome c family protein
MSRGRYRLAHVRRLAPLAFLLVLLFLAAGCGSGTIASPKPTTVVGAVPKPQTPTVPAKYKNGDATAGAALFKNGPCGGCHTLADAGTHGTVGPNLDQAKPSLSLAVDRLLNGAGAMPSFKATFSTKQIADIAAYVVKTTGGNPNG